MLDLNYKNLLDKCILCWLATTGDLMKPNVSPKEIFHHYEDNYIIIANIASPKSVRNIRLNPKVCLSMIDILVQKGAKFMGTATIVQAGDPEYSNMEEVLLSMTAGKFPFREIIKIKVEQIKPIISPRYQLYPDTTEENQIQSAKKAYGL